MSKLANNAYANPLIAHAQIEHRWNPDMCSYERGTERFFPGSGDDAVAWFVSQWRTGDHDRFCDTDQLGLALLARYVETIEKEYELEVAKNPTRDDEVERLSCLKQSLDDARLALAERVAH